MSDVDAARWDRVDARGSVTATDVIVRSGALPQAIAVHEATAKAEMLVAEARARAEVLVGG